MAEVIGHLTKEEKETIKSLLSRHFKDSEAVCYIFGSAARGDLRLSSDIDLLIEAPQDIRAELSLFREDLEDSNLLRNVDVVWYRDAPEQLLKNVKKEGEILWRS